MNIHACSNEDGVYVFAEHDGPRCDKRAAHDDLDALITEAVPCCHPDCCHDGGCYPAVRALIEKREREAHLAHEAGHVAAKNIAVEEAEARGAREALEGIVAWIAGRIKTDPLSADSWEEGMIDVRDEALRRAKGEK
jgi:hypothetical protein